MSAAKKKTTKKRGVDAPSVTWEQARAFRLARMHLVDPLGPRSVRKVVRDLGGVQAQVASAGELQIAVRAQGLAQGAIERAIYKQRTLVKSWMMRGTLHWVDAADYAVWAAASRTRAPWNKNYWQKYFGVTAKQVEAAVDAIGNALDGQCLTREQIADEVHARLKNKAIDEQLRSGWGSVLKIAASQGMLCFGPSEGRNVAFVRPDQWLKGFKHLDVDESIAEVLRRYLVAHGPATREEFARWWGFQPADARRVIESIESELVLVDREGDKAYVLKKDLKAIQTAEEDAELRALGMFDAYTLAGLPHTSIVPTAKKALVYRTGAWVSQVIMRGGQVVGVWTHKAKPSGTDFEVKLFKKKSVPKSTIERALEPLLPFTGDIKALKIA